MLKKISFVFAVAALVVGVSSTANAAYMFNTDLTLGSTGPDVVALQDVLVNGTYLVMPAGVAKGYFGTLTQAAAAKWQAAAGITPAVGYIGPISRAKLNAMDGTPTPGLPAGCTSTMGYSTVDGKKCDSATSGLPGGCTSTMGYSPITGNKCDSSTTGGSLSGGAGDITVTERSSGVEDEVMEGEEEVKVLGFEIEADGSDIAITSVRVEFEHTGSGNDRLDRYVDEVVIMQGDKVVGSADVGDFSESSDVYSENIAISGATVGEDETERFYVAVSAVNNIDSSDLGEAWDLDLGQIRFEDATGAILTENPSSIASTFTFEDLTTSGDVELTVNEDDDDINEAQTIQVDASSDTNDVEILSFTIDADGSDLTLEQIIFDITSSGSGVTEIANDFRLMMGGEEVGRVRYDLDQNDSDSDHNSASSTDTAIAIIVTDIDEDDVVVEAGDTVSFTLVADINDIDGAFTDGDSLSVSLANADIDAEDENGDSVTDLNGSASSGPLAFSSTGLMVTVTNTPTPVYLTGLSDDSTDDQGEFVMEFEVTAFEDTAWIELTAASSTDADTSNVGVAFSMENGSTGAASQTGTTSAVLTRVSGGTTSGNFVRINAGQTAKFKLTVNHDASATAFYRVQMNEVGFNQTSAASANDAKELTPAADYQSDSIQVRN